MSTKQNGAEAAKMTEAELSKRLGSYQTQSVLGTWVGLIAVIGGVISYFVVDHPAVRAILTAVLFFGGIGCAIFVAGGAQKKIKALSEHLAQRRISCSVLKSDRVFLFFMAFSP